MFANLLRINYLLVQQTSEIPRRYFVVLYITEFNIIYVNFINYITYLV